MRLYKRLLEQAQGDEMLLLPRVEAHWPGMAIGLVSVAAGVALFKVGAPGANTWGWVAMAGMIVGMLLHWRWKKLDTGWQVHFAQRRVAPVGVRGQPALIEGGGWAIHTAPGDRRASIAIDLRHPDLGRVARLFESPARRGADQRCLSQLADTLARRLGVDRAGPQL